MGNRAAGEWLGICHGAAILGWSSVQGKSSMGFCDGLAA